MENNNEILSEDEMNILTLTDEFGNETEFEYLDVIEYKGEEYLVLLPTAEDNDEIVILLIEPVDEEMKTTWPWKTKRPWPLFTRSSRSATRTF